MGDFDADTSHSEIFPLAQPFKSLYAIHALKEYIVGQTQKVGKKVHLNWDNMLKLSRLL